MPVCTTITIPSIFPEGFDPLHMLPTLGFIIAVVFILALIIRVVADKASKYNHALASATAILFMYIILMMMHNGDGPKFVVEALNVLPLVHIEDGKILLFSFAQDNVLEIFREFLYAFILSLVLIGLDDLIPDAKNGFAWIILQVFVASLSVFVYWGIIQALESFIPGVLDSYAPLILGCILLFMILLGVLKVIMGLLLVAVNPLLGAISAFFGTAPLGKVLGKAALCAIFLCAVAIFMSASGFTSFALVNMTFAVCVLPLLVLMLLWFLIGYIL